MKDYKAIESRVLNILEVKLPSYLTYHCLEHTIYVVEKSEYIAKKQGVSRKKIYLLKIAALFHDIGFISTYAEHEKKSCSIAKKELKSFDFNQKEIDLICGMIMATKIPQQPTTELENIIADADLEYLATNKFLETGNLLYNELKHFNKDLTLKKWNKIQISFISDHQFHTKYCRQYKERWKQKNLDYIKSL